MEDEDYVISLVGKDLLESAALYSDERTQHVRDLIAKQAQNTVVELTEMAIKRGDSDGTE